MRKAILATTLLLAIPVPALSGNKLSGTTTLKDLKPYGTPDKDHKHQAYDLSFQAEGKSYTCRTDPNKSLDATAFIVNTDMKYKIDGNNGELKNPAGKDVKCKIVRVEALPTQ
jgi:hypothetical protein